VGGNRGTKGFGQGNLDYKGGWKNGGHVASEGSAPRGKFNFGLKVRVRICRGVLEGGQGGSAEPGRDQP